MELCVYHPLQYIPRNLHTVFALLCFVVVIHWLLFPYPSGLLHWHCGNLTIAPVPAKQPWWIWINTSCEFIMKVCITTTKQSTTKPCAYFLGYTVLVEGIDDRGASRKSCCFQNSFEQHWAELNLNWIVLFNVIVIFCSILISHLTHWNASDIKYLKFQNMNYLHGISTEVDIIW